jgi:CRISPR/Cas system-associated exonuclease Cas4 (RecB family)
MGWASMLIEELDVDEVRIKHLYAGPLSGIKRDPALIKRKKSAAIKNTIQEIALSIKSKISYPSFTSACAECPFQRKCRL